MNSKKYKKIFLITSNRSEYGILRNLIQNFKSSKKLKLNLVVTGAHLNKLFGYTVKEIIKDSNTVLNITVTNEDGFFELKTNSKKPLIIVEFLGYEKIRLENISIPKYNLNLGTILLK